MFRSRIGEKEKYREQYVDAVRRLFVETFGLSGKQMREGDKIWKEWLELRKDLKELMESDEIGEAFKARAIVSFVAPDADWSPFAWRQEVHLGSEWASLTPRLQKFSLAVFELMETFDGRTSFQALCSYNEFIHSELARLPEDDPMAERLACCYQPYYEKGGEKAGIQFERLLGANIPKRWKVLIDQKMRAEILRASESNSASNLPLACYMYAVGVSSKSDADFRASQIEFILDFPGMDDNRLYALDEFCKEWGAGVFAGDQHANLRLRLGQIQQRLTELRARSAEESRPIREERERERAQADALERGVLAKMK